MSGDNIQQLVNNDVHYFGKQTNYQSMKMTELDVLIHANNTAMK